MLVQHDQINSGGHCPLVTEKISFEFPVNTEYMSTFYLRQYKIQHLQQYARSKKYVHSRAIKQSTS